jgi:chorismate mutase
MRLDKIREKIDNIDSEILNKLNERLELALQAKKFKKETLDRKREIQVLRKVKKHAQRHNLLSSGFIEKIFIEIINESRKLQDEEVK